MASKEVTVSSTQGLTRVFSDVVSLLETEKEAKITAINMAIPSAVNLVELIKHRIKGLHQQNSFERVPDSTKTRVIFHLTYAALNTSHSGYQQPLNDSEVTEKSFAELKKPPTSSGSTTRRIVSDQGEETKRPEGTARRSVWGRNRGRGEGRTRGGEGRSRGGEGRSRGGETRSRGSEGRPRDGESKPRDPDNRAVAGESRRENRDFGEGGRRPRGRGGRGFRRGGRGGRNGRGGRFAGEGGQRREPGMEKYQLVRNREELKKGENEIFVSGGGNPIFPIKDALMMFKKAGQKSVIIKASGLALPKAVRVAEEVKSKEPGLHQQNSFAKRTIKDLYKATEEGLSDITKERTIEGIEIILSKAPLDTKHSGYQAPIAADKVKNLTVEEVEKL